MDLSRSWERKESTQDTTHCANGSKSGTRRTWKTPEGTRTKQRHGGYQVGPVGPTCQVGRPGSTAKWALLRVAASNRPI
jgi:hypothetical protein